VYDVRSDALLVTGAVVGDTTTQGSFSRASDSDETISIGDHGDRRVEAADDAAVVGPAAEPEAEGISAGPDQAEDGGSAGAKGMGGGVVEGEDVW
jgi:hypothetical protein